MDHPTIEEIAAELGEPVEIVREMLDAMEAVAEEARIEAEEVAIGPIVRYLEGNRS